MEFTQSFHGYSCQGGPFFIRRSRDSIVESAGKLKRDILVTFAAFGHSGSLLEFFRKINLTCLGGLGRIVWSEQEFT